MSKEKDKTATFETLEILDLRGERKTAQQKREELEEKERLEKERTKTIEVSTKKSPIKKEIEDESIYIIKNRKLKKDEYVQKNIHVHIEHAKKLEAVSKKTNVTMRELVGRALEQFFEKMVLEDELKK